MNDDFRMMPHDIEAEQCALGGMLISANVCALAVGQLSADDFYRPAHQIVFLAAATLYRRSTPVDSVSVRAELDRAGRLEQAGTALYLHELTAVIPTAANGAYYVERVRELGAKRIAMEEMIRAVEDGYKSTSTSEDLLATVDDVAARLRGLVVDDSAIAGLSTMGAFVDESDAEYDWLIPGVLERMDRVIVVASEGAGKTTWARQIAVMAAAGVHPFAWAERIPPVRTLYVDLENPPALIRRKARHLMDTGRFVPGWDDDRCWRWTRPGGVDLRKPHDQFLLDRVIRESRAEMVLMGPLYKAFAEAGSEKAEVVNGEVARVLDGFRERYGVALWIETHAPMEQQGQRSLRPLGSGVWSRWPEFGLALRKSKSDPHVVSLDRFRGDRDERMWPHRLRRSAPWPWSGEWDGGFPIEEATSA